MNRKTSIFNQEFSKAKQLVLVRDDFTCQAPREDHFAGLTVDHIRKRSVGGSNSLKNLITLCLSHHSYYEELPSQKKEEELRMVLRKKYGYVYRK